MDRRQAEERILYVTPGYRLIALNAKTGVPIPTFGNDGVVDLKLDDDQEIDLVTGEVGLHSTPVVAGDVVIVGAAHRSGGVPKSMTQREGLRARLRRPHRQAPWIFHTIPKPGEFGIDTWLNDSCVLHRQHRRVGADLRRRSNSAWCIFRSNCPPAITTAAHRPGNGLFGESIVAVDLKTGKRKWHYQLVHHGLWDMDIPCAPILTDITVNGQTVKALAQPTKQAFLYVFDRVTGEPIWPIERGRCRKATCPASGIRPRSRSRRKPPAYDRQGVSDPDI